MDKIEEEAEGLISNYNAMKRIAVVTGIMVSAHAMYEAWIYNTGQDIHSDGVIHWGHWLIVGLFWFIPISSIVFMLGLLIAGIVELCARSKRRQKDLK